MKTELAQYLKNKNQCLAIFNMNRSSRLFIPSYPITVIELLDIIKHYNYEIVYFKYHNDRIVIKRLDGTKFVFDLINPDTPIKKVERLVQKHIPNSQYLVDKLKEYIELHKDRFLKTENDYKHLKYSHTYSDLKRTIFSDYFDIILYDALIYVAKQLRYIHIEEE